MKNKIVLIILVIVGLGFIGFGVYKGFIEKKDEVPTQEVKVAKMEYSGVYQNGNTSIKIYEKKENVISFSMETIDSSVSFEGNINNNKVSKSIFDTNYILTFNDNNFVIETNNDKIVNGTYNKVSNYTMKDYFNDNYGNETYLNSKYNGEFKNDNIMAYLYQKDEKTVRVFISKDFTSQDLEYEIKEDGNLYTEMFDKNYEITFDDNKFTFKENSNEQIKVFDGIYTKAKSLTMEEIIEKFI